MHASTVAIDLAKEVFELAFADAQGRVIERKRLSRRAFIRSLETRPPLRVLMEACGGAHCWARRFQRQGHAVRLLPARDVRPYVRGNKVVALDEQGDLLAHYAFSPRVKVGAHLNNLFDEKYCERSYSNLWVMPGEPRNLSFNLTLDL